MNELFLPHNISRAEYERVRKELEKYPDANMDIAEYSFEEDKSFWLILPDKDVKILIMASQKPQQQPTP